MLGFEVGKRYGQEECGCAGEHRHDNTCGGERARDKQCDGEGDKGKQRAHENAHAAQVHFSDLLQAAFVDVGQAIDCLVDNQTYAQRAHCLVVAAYGAIRGANHNGQQARDNAAYLVFRERIGFRNVADLVCSDAEMRHNQKQHGNNVGHGEHTRLLGAGKLRDDDGQGGEDHTPHAHADDIPNVVAAGLVCLELLVFLVEGAIARGTQQAVAPLRDNARKEAGLVHFLRALFAGPVIDFFSQLRQYLHK